MFDEIRARDHGKHRVRGGSVSPAASHTALKILCGASPIDPSSFPSTAALPHASSRHYAGLLVGTLGALQWAGMVTINPEREARRLGRPTDPLRLFEWGFELTARCGGAGCGHARELPVPLLIKAYGHDATLEHVAAHMRCSRCGLRGARIVAKYVGRRGDGR